MAFDFVALMSALVDHSATLGFFDRVNDHEPPNAPGAQLTAHIWLDTILPLPAASGLASVSGLVVMNERIQCSANRQPYGLIETDLAAAAGGVVGSLAGNFTLNVTGVRDLDVLGAHGYALACKAGYLTQDQKLYRVMVVTIPVVVNDLWSEAA